MSKVHCLHGFLGLPSDWNFLHEHLEGEVLSWNWSECFEKSFDFETLANSLLEKYEKNINGGDYLIGYSLGGRILLHLLPKIKKDVKVILIAAHPGLDQVEEKQLRLISDLEWSQKFLRLPWKLLMERWNSNDIFNQDLSYERDEHLFKRDQLSKMLLELSLGKQKKMSIPKDALYLVGENDKKFKKIAEKLECNKIIVANAYHRLPWEKKEEFATLIKGVIYE